jgi:hypothetical protein
VLDDPLQRLLEPRVVIVDLNARDASTAGRADLQGVRIAVCVSANNGVDHVCHQCHEPGSFPKRGHQGPAAGHMAITWAAYL